MILLLANPFSLFDLGFQLTFAATLAIILIAPPAAMMKSGAVLSLKVGESTVAIDMGADDFLEWRDLQQRHACRRLDAGKMVLSVSSWKRIIMIV
jgi:hypothetical protein